MAEEAHAITRRTLLARAALGAGGLALAGGLGEVVSLATASSPGQPRVPHYLTRPDLRIPALTVTKREPGVSQDAIFIAPYNAPDGAQAGAVIADNDGQPLWENPIANRVTTNFRVQSYRGSPVLTWWQGEIELGHGVGEYVIADAAYNTIRRVQAVGRLRGDLHEFVITPRDTALLTSYELRKAKLTGLGGTTNGIVQDAIFQELDLASGELLMEWHSVEHVPFSQSYSPVTADWDYFHINSVDLDHDGALLVSSRSMHTVYKIDRNGEVLWRLGGKDSDFRMLPGSEFAWQHDARRQPDRTVTLFDNGATPAVEKLSRGIVLELDESAMTASLQRQYTHPGVLAGSQGSVQQLSNGNVFIGWGEVPRVSEFDEDGRIVFDALLGAKYQCYRAFRMPWSATPSSAPDVAARGRAVYASWNGATEVSAWRLRSGAAPGSLTAGAAITPRSGFETRMRAQRDARYAAVEAIDATGRTLGRSATIAIGA